LLRVGGADPWGQILYFNIQISVMLKYKI